MLPGHDSSPRSLPAYWRPEPLISEGVYWWRSWVEEERSIGYENFRTKDLVYSDSLNLIIALIDTKCIRVRCPSMAKSLCSSSQ